MDASASSYSTDASAAALVGNLPDGVGEDASTSSASFGNTGGGEAAGSTGTGGGGEGGATIGQAYPGSTASPTTASANTSSSTGDATPPIPAGLIKAIASGNCVAFIGAGFSAAAKLPKWGELMHKVIKSAVDDNRLREKELEDFLTKTVNEAMVTGAADKYDLVAQLMEDRLGAAKVESYLREHCTAPKDLPQLMKNRLSLLDAIPFRAILTTNFDAFLLGLTPRDSDRPFSEVLRPSIDMRSTLRYSVDELVRDHIESEGSSTSSSDSAASSIHHREGRPIIKLHGDLDSGNSLVWTRTGYRRLLHFTPGYTNFVRSVLATSTVLYLGFSFSDGYLNELRGEVLSMLRSTSSSPMPGLAPASSSSAGGFPPSSRQRMTSMLVSSSSMPATVQPMIAAIVDAVSATSREAADADAAGEDPPIGYALVHDKGPYEIEFFRRHEGVQIITWPSPIEGTENPDYEGFDRILRKIFDSTSYSHNIGRMIEGKRILVLEWRRRPPPSASSPSSTESTITAIPTASSPSNSASSPSSNSASSTSTSPPVTPLTRSQRQPSGLFSVSSTHPGSPHLGSANASYIVNILEDVGRAYFAQKVIEAKKTPVLASPSAPAFSREKPESFKRTALWRGGVLDAVGTVEDAIACVQANKETPYDVVLTIFGEDRESVNKDQHVWIRFISEMRKLPPECHAPVIVYSTNYNTAQRRKYVLKNGGFAFCYTLHMTVEALERLLDDKEEAAAENLAKRTEDALKKALTELGGHPYGKRTA